MYQCNYHIFKKKKILVFLISSIDQACTEDHTLQNAFIQHLIRKLRRPENVEEWVEEIYAVLAVMPWSSRRSDGQLEALCEALWAARVGPLKEERILSSLLRPQCDALVSTYCSTALRLQRDHLLRSSPHTQGSPFKEIYIILPTIPCPPAFPNLTNSTFA